MAEVIDRTLKAQTPSYQTILELDRKVREKRLPPHLDAPFSEDEAVSPSQYMRRHMFLQMRMIVLTYIHRSFFARALLDHPANPLCSPYAPSFLSAYRCALVVINNCNRFVNRMPDLCFRSGLLWTHLFAAAVSQTPRSRCDHRPDHASHIAHRGIYRNSSPSFYRGSQCLCRIWTCRQSF
jgi:hypothetical protein